MVSLHLIRFDDSLEGMIPHPEAWLDEAEMARYKRERSRPARSIFMAGRVALKSLIGRRLGLEPRTISIAKGTYGKPHESGGRLGLSLAHTRGMVAVALSSSDGIGVDIEPADRTFPDPDILAKLLLEEDDRTPLLALNEEEKRARILSAFVQKEAWLKSAESGMFTSFPAIPITSSAPPYYSATSILFIEACTHPFLVCARSVSPVGLWLRHPVESIESVAFPAMAASGRPERPTLFR
jgi:4'-phosphopantetheinyl transferase